MARVSERRFIDFCFTTNISLILILGMMLAIIFSLILSSVPIFLSLLFIFLIELTVAWTWWKKGMDSILFNALTGFLAFMNLGAIAILPLLHFTFGSILFWILLLFYFIYFGVLLFKRKIVVNSIHNPQQSKIAIGFFIAMSIVMFMGGLATGSPGQDGFILYFFSETGQAIYIYSVLYAIGLIMTLFSVIMLYPMNKEYEEQPRRRKKKSRAQRRKEALKQRTKK